MCVCVCVSVKLTARKIRDALAKTNERLKRQTWRVTRRMPRLKGVKIRKAREKLSQETINLFMPLTCYESISVCVLGLEVTRSDTKTEVGDAPSGKF